ncbi:hypothetical protein Pth03_61010 [Planotetraspora thailandica]|uniref:Uncharacterized protein n=1 Tax=Planotetraspora thailandica TaxID=487172 RepID=A0A8J3XWK1_9ACTN|nr:hypothetical protein [Planotetraspora thailandica]GII57712.1 hypothetical protein Pth03_61010 [Planotetraspora thailandica]
MLELFGLTGRNVFLAVGTGALILGGVFSFGSGDQRAGGVLLQIAMIAMIGAVACAVSERRKKE